MDGEQVTKPRKSSVVFGKSWCATSVLGSQVFRQASMENCANPKARLEGLDIPNFNL